MTSDDAAHRIGLIADTHGMVRPDVAEALAGVELIMHAGDVGGNAVLEELALIAPVHAVLGNTDPPGVPRLSAELVREVGGLTIHVSHGHELGNPTPERLASRYAADVIIYGHTHHALVTRLEQKLIINPGAAGPRRFNVRPSVGLLTISVGSASIDIVPLRA